MPQRQHVPYIQLDLEGEHRRQAAEWEKGLWKATLPHIRETGGIPKAKARERKVTMSS